MRTRLSRHAVWMRLFAAVLVAVILADVALDGNCDPFPVFAGGQAALTAGANADANASAGEACADQCVPDCFCCSRGVAPGPAALPPRLGPATWAPAFCAPAAPVGRSS